MHAWIILDLAVDRVLEVDGHGVVRGRVIVHLFGHLALVFEAAVT